MNKLLLFFKKTTLRQSLVVFTGLVSLISFSSLPAKAWLFPRSGDSFMDRMIFESEYDGPLCMGKEPTILGTSGSDILWGTRGDDVIHGLRGNDLIFGRGGDDTICGGNGRDILLGNSGDDHILGGGNKDLIKGGKGDDVLDGERGKDSLLGGTGDDQLIGGDGSDFLNGGRGDDYCEGDSGFDVSRLCESESGIEVSGTNPADKIRVKTQFNALVLHYNPYVIDRDGIDKSVTEALGLRPIEPLMDDYVDVLKKASGGQVNWKVSETFHLNEFPPENDSAVTYTPENFIGYRDANYDMLGKTDYISIINDERFGIKDKVESGELDAIWVFAFPGAGFYETSMAGEGAYYINGAAVTGVDISKKFVIYGFGNSSHQHVGFMLENTGHMVENILFRRGENWPKKWSIPVWNSFDLNSSERYLTTLELSDWQLFHLTDSVNYDAPDQNTGLQHLSAPVQSHVGTIHYPPNAVFNYGWPSVLEEFGSDRRWIAFDNGWRISSGRYVVDAGDGLKSLLHDGGADRPFSMSDFRGEVEVSVANDESSSHAGMLFRMEKFSGGINQGKGYYAAIDAYNDRVVLYKLDNVLTELASASRPIEADTFYRVRVAVNHQSIKVYLDDEVDPALDVIDRSFQTGALGVVAYDTEAAFERFEANASVINRADNWHNYPALGYETHVVNSLNWNESHDGYLSWWFEHLPKNPGFHDDGILNTWWPYIFDINQFDPSERYSKVVFAQPDRVRPQSPDGLEVIELESRSLKLIWTEPYDNLGVTRYDIYRNGAFVQQVGSRVFSDEGLVPGEVYTYGIAARDGSGNVSVQTTLVVETLLEDSVGLLNDDFEEGGSGAVSYWTADPWKPADAIMLWTPAGEGVDGSKAVSIEHTAENDSRWIQTITDLEPGSRYRLSGWIKGQDIVNVTGTIGANLGLFPHGVQAIVSNGTFDWVEVSVEFVAPDSGSVTIGCRLGHNGNTTTGKVWFDNIKVELVEL